MRRLNWQPIIIIGFSFLAILVWITPASAQWPNGYTHQRTITISHTKVPNTDQVNFPVLFSGTYPYLATTSNSGQVTNANGYDIVFTSDSAGTMPLPFERESYVASSGAVSFWVQVPTVSHTTDTVIYVFYGNSSVTTDQSNKGAVWDSNFVLVSHLSDNAANSTVADSTSNSNNLANAANTSSKTTSGEISAGLAYNGSSDYSSIANNSSLNIQGSAVTVEAWAKPAKTNATNYERLVTKEVPGNADPFLRYGLNRINGSSQVGFRVSTGGTGSGAEVDGGSLSAGNWTHVVGVYDGSLVRLYTNGSLIGSASKTGNIAGSTTPLDLARDSETSFEYFNGALDEVRISNSARSADWIATEYNNQSNPSTFYSVGLGDWNNGYSYQAPITISHTEVPNTDQTSFPVLISGTYPYLATTANSGQVTNANGYDIIFTSDAAGTNKLDHEIDSYSPATGTANFWVRIPTVSHLVDTVIYMFYGNPNVTTSQENKPGVWKNNYLSVYHLGNGTAVGTTDSGSSGYNLSGSATAVTGKISGGVSFNGSASTYLYHDSVTGYPSGASPVTLEAWVQVASTSSDETFGYGANNANGSRAAIGDNGTTAWLEFQNMGVNASHSFDTNWHHLVGVYNGGALTTGSALIYRDGVVASNAASGGTPNTTTTEFKIGGIPTVTFCCAMNGSVDEVRVSSGVRSADWIATEYNNQSSPSTFYSVGSIIPAPTLTSLSPTSGAGGTVVTITGSNFGSSQGSSTVTFNGVSATPTSWNNTQVTVAVPIGVASGSVVVTVSGVPSNPLTFTDSSAGIIALLPVSGPISAPITIVGANFGVAQGSSVVTFNGIAGTPTSWSNSIIVVPVPSGAATGNVVVTVASGSSNSAAFTVTVPTVSTLSPNSGAVGSSVTISGSSFGPSQAQGASTVTFNGTSAAITSWSSTNIVASVPAAATTGNVVVTVAGVSSSGASFTVVPSLTSLAPLSGIAGTSITITGTGFEPTQGSSTVAVNGIGAVATSWSNTSITAVVPTGATSGNVVVTVGGYASNGLYFTALPTGWLDQDIGNVGTAGSAVYANGVFTITGGGAGVFIGDSADAFNYMYQSLSGDGSVTARVTSEPGATGYTEAGVMIRETLNSNAIVAFPTYYYGQKVDFFTRSTTGGGLGATDGAAVSLPEWIKVVRSGSTFSGYQSIDGVNWTAANGSPATISMAQNAYIGLGVAQGQASHAVTATLDYVSVNSAAAPAPSITSVSANTAAPGSQIVITGAGFGSSQGISMVELNGSAATVNSWSGTSITITIPAGATSGPLAVFVAPSMNASNAIPFSVTSQPVPSGWLDQDIGAVGTAGGGTYSNGVFTVTAGGTGVYGGSDSFNFVYQTTTTDGVLVARVASVTGGSAQTQAGAMFRETLTPSSTTAFTTDYNWSGQQISFFTRATTGASPVWLDSNIISPPYWVMVERSGSTFRGFQSADGVHWTQTGYTTTVSMAQNAYIGLAVAKAQASSPVTATFDNVSFTSELVPYVSSVSPTSGLVGTTVTVNGSDFGSSQGSSTLSIGGVVVTSVSSWSNTQIVATVAGTWDTGPVTVVVNGVQSNSNVIFTCLTPVISSLLPPAGPIGGTIFVQGHNFGASQGSSTVQFNGLNASITGWSDTSIAAVVPTNATTGPVTVIEGGTTSNSAQFSIIEPATVSALSPNSAAIGASIVITGTGFGPAQSDSTVNFTGATATTITNWSDTSITATVPVGTQSGPFYVGVAGQQAFGPNFNLTSSAVVTDSLGNTSTYISEMAGGMWVSAQSQGSGCTSCSTRGNFVNTFDVNGNLLTSTDPLGYKTTYAYDSASNTLSQSTPLNGTTNATTSYTYNSLGEVLTVTDPLGNVTTNAYDPHGNLLTVTSPAPNSSTAASVTTFGYNSLGELTTITDPLSHVTTMTYTTAGLVATITDAQSNVTTYGYDAKGNRTSVTDALNHTTTFAYDAMNRLTTITYPDSTTSSFAYDYRGRRTSSTDQNGKTTSYAYDDADRLTSVTDAASHVTYYAYDTEDNLTSITDANSNQTAFTYDAFGRVTSTNFPSSLSETYQYDADNNLTQKTDRKGQTITYLYDALNRLTSKTYPDSTAVDYVYDLVGKIQQVNDPTGTYAFAYDNIGRLIGTTTSYSFLTSRNFTNAYTYDAASNRTGFTDPEGGSTTYAYDALNRLNSLAPPSAFGSGSFGFSYDALSRRTQMTRPNSVTTSYAYDNLSRLTSVLHQLSGSTIDGASYTLDSAGSRTAKMDQMAGVTSNYSYDAIYELTQVTQANNATESYSYDAVGNRAASLAVSSYTTNASNEMTANSNTSYTYDSNGNTLAKTVGSEATTYAWDNENRLTSVTLPGSGGTVTFKYDPLGRRIYKSTSGGTSVFAYDGDNLIEETNSSGTVVARYEQTDDADEPLAMFRSSTTSYYNADGLGSITSLANGSGTLTQTYTFDSFGKLTASSGSVINPFQYTGREFDSETGLYYYRARYYDPSSGRFNSEDPLLFGGGDTNFYSYVGADSTNYTDPSGLHRFHVYHPGSRPWRFGWTHSDNLPAGSVVDSAPDGTAFIAPPSANWCKEYANALGKHRDYSAIGPAVGQTGTYDYQRDNINRIEYGVYQDAANYSVGVYMRGAGYGRLETMGMGLLYASRHSNNFSWKSIVYWTHWWGQGWDAANSGKYSNCGCNN